MKKINKEKSLRLGIMTIVMSSVMGLSGCQLQKGSKPKTLTKEQKERIVEYDGQMNHLGALIDICEEVNDNEISTDYKRADGENILIYKNYPTNDIKEKEEYQTIQELKDKVSKINNLPYNGKLDLIAYINKTVNKYDIVPVFEGLYREILATASGINDIDLQPTEEMSYLEEGKTMIELSDENPIETLIKYYGIGEDEASWLVRIIRLTEDKPNRNELYKMMEENPEFGTEDYIPAYLKKLEYIYEAYHKLKERFKEKYDSNNFGYKQKVKRK